MTWTAVVIALAAGLGLVVARSLRRSLGPKRPRVCGHSWRKAVPTLHVDDADCDLEDALLVGHINMAHANILNWAAL